MVETDQAKMGTGGRALRKEAGHLYTHDQRRRSKETKCGQGKGETNNEK